MEVVFQGLEGRGGGGGGFQPLPCTDFKNEPNAKTEFAHPVHSFSFCMNRHREETLERRRRCRRLRFKFMPQLSSADRCSQPLLDAAMRAPPAKLKWQCGKGPRVPIEARYTNANGSLSGARTQANALVTENLAASWASRGKPVRGATTVSETLLKPPCPSAAWLQRKAKGLGSECEWAEVGLGVWGESAPTPQASILGTLCRIN